MLDIIKFITYLLFFSIIIVASFIKYVFDYEINLYTSEEIWRKEKVERGKKRHHL